MTICLNCSRPSTHSAVIAGTLYSRLCDSHYNELVRSQMPTSGQGSYDRQRDLEDHLQDVQQPMTSAGINPEWTKLWPDRARQMFKSEDIEAAERKN